MALLLARPVRWTRPAHLFALLVLLLALPAVAAPFRAIRWEPAENALDYIVCIRWEAAEEQCQVALSGATEMPLSAFMLDPGSYFQLVVVGRGADGTYGPESVGNRLRATCIPADISCDGAVGHPDMILLSLDWGKALWDVVP